MALATSGSFRLLAIALALSLMVGMIQTQGGWTKWYSNSAQAHRLEADSATSSAALVLKDSTVIYATIYRISDAGSGSGSRSRPADDDDESDRSSGGSRGGSNGSGYVTYTYYLIVRDVNGMVLDTVHLPLDMPYVINAFIDSQIMVYGTDGLQRYFFNAITGKLTEVDSIPIAINRATGTFVADPYNKNYVALLTVKRLVYFNAKNFMSEDDRAEIFNEIYGEQYTLAINQKYIISFAHMQRTLRLHDKMDNSLRVVNSFDYGKASTVLYKFMHANEDNIFCLAQVDGSSFGVILDINHKMFVPKASSGRAETEYGSSFYLPSLNVFGGVVFGKEGGFVLYPTNPTGTQLIPILLPVYSIVTGTSNLVELNGRVYFDTTVNTAKSFYIMPAFLDPFECMTSELTPGVYCRTCKLDKSSRCIGKRGQKVPAGMGLDVVSLTFKPCADPDCAVCAGNFRICRVCKEGFFYSELTRTCAKPFRRSSFKNFLGLVDVEELLSSPQVETNGILFEKNRLLVD